MTPLQYLKDHGEERMEQLFAFLRFPSVSAKSEHKPDMTACAKWVTDHLRNLGFQAQVHETPGHPIVYAEMITDKALPTVLYYGHYDVQPVEPLNLWKSEPFAPVIRDEQIFARGATDDKGQVFAHIKGLEAILKTDGKLPINVKFVIEGEEEISSTNLPKWLKANKKMLAADVVVVSDSSQFSKTLPAVTYGLRGIAAMELFVYGPNRDLHSGSFGGAVPNPATILCQMIAQMHDKNGKIAVPGFYKDVKQPSKWERAQFKKLPFVESAYKKMVGVPSLHGEKGWNAYERTWVRPTFEINGITSGYQGEGSKTIIPSWASCKITCRLVPAQDPNDIMKKIEAYVKKIAPKSVRTELRKYGGAKAVVVPTDGPWLEAAGRALKAGFGKAPVFIREGGSIPVVGDFKEILGIDTLLLGFGQNDDNTHSPNERFRVVDFERGCRTAAMLPFELAKTKRG